MMYLEIIFAVIFLLLLLFIKYLLFCRCRSAKKVLRDLADQTNENAPKKQEKLIINKSKFCSNTKDKTGVDILSILTISEIKHFRYLKKLNIVSGLLLGIFIGGFVLKVKFSIVWFYCILGLLAGFLYSEFQSRQLEELIKKNIVFYLPIVMERIVMAVQSGLDILPAIKTIEEIERLSTENNHQIDFSKIDIVTRLFGKVINFTEAGSSFEQSLHEVANSINCNILRHCFIHLAVAQKEGGELIYPLRELSDATQLYFQESVEEEISRMPIKATMPLLLTFAGLIISFMTGPVIQILNMSVNSHNHAKQSPRQVVIEVPSVQKSKS